MLNRKSATVCHCLAFCPCYADCSTQLCFCNLHEICDEKRPCPMLLGEPCLCAELITLCDIVYEMRHCLAQYEFASIMYAYLHRRCVCVTYVKCSCSIEATCTSICLVARCALPQQKLLTNCLHVRAYQVVYLRFCQYCSYSACICMHTDAQW